MSHQSLGVYRMQNPTCVSDMSAVVSFPSKEKPYGQFRSFSIIRYGMDLEASNNLVIGTD